MIDFKIGISIFVSFNDKVVMYIFVLDEEKDGIFDSDTMAYVGIGALVGIIVLVALVGIIVWKKEKNKKKNPNSTQGIYF